MSATSASGITKKEVVVQPAYMQARTIDLKNKGTFGNSTNKVVALLWGNLNQIGTVVFQYLELRSSAHCSLICKHWHVLRTSNVVSRLLLCTHFKVLFPIDPNSQIVEGTYWNRYRALGEIYPNAKRFAFQPSTSVDFSKPSHAVEGVSAPPMQGTVSQVSIRPDPENMLLVDTVMSCFTTTEVLDKATQERKQVFHSKVQMRNNANRCTFQADHLGIVTVLAASPFAPLLVTGMKDGSIVFWHTESGTELGTLTFPFEDIAAIDQPVDPQLNLSPLTKAVEGVLFCNETTIWAGYNDGTSCKWTWSWNDTHTTCNFNPEVNPIPHFRLSKLFQSPDQQTGVIYGRSYQEPYDYGIWVFESDEKPIKCSFENLSAEAMTFLSNTTIAFAFPNEEGFRSSVRVFDLERDAWNILIDEIETVSGFDLRFNDRVLVISSFERDQRAEQTTFIKFFDLQRKVFIHNPDKGSIDFQKAPKAHLDTGTSKEVLTTPPQQPSFLTVLERTEKRVIFFDFMTPQSDLFFSNNATIPLQDVRSLAIIASDSSASASSSGSGGGPASVNGSRYHALTASSATVSPTAYLASASGSGSGHATAALAKSGGATQKPPVATATTPPAYLNKKRKRDDTKDQKG